jgi:peptidyl-prolyl cis-trans isomerase D
VQTEYDSRKSEFDIPEKRVIVQAVLPDEAAAKALADKVRQGAPFAEAVKSATSNDPVDVGTFAQADLQQQLTTVFPDAAAAREATEALFAAAVGGATAPVKGAIGWHVLSVSGIEPPKVQPLDDDLRAKLNRALAVRQAIDELADVGTQLDDELGGGLTWPTPPASSACPSRRSPPWMPPARIRRARRSPTSSATRARLCSSPSRPTKAKTAC